MLTQLRLIYVHKESFPCCATSNRLKGLNSSSMAVIFYYAQSCPEKYSQGNKNNHWASLTERSSEYERQTRQDGANGVPRATFSMHRTRFFPSKEPLLP